MPGSLEILKQSKTAALDGTFKAVETRVRVTWTPISDFKADYFEKLQKEMENTLAQLTTNEEKTKNNYDEEIRKQGVNTQAVRVTMGHTDVVTTKEIDDRWSEIDTLCDEFLDTVGKKYEDQADEAIKETKREYLEDCRNAVEQLNSEKGKWCVRAKAIKKGLDGAINHVKIKNFEELEKKHKQIKAWITGGKNLKSRKPKELTKFALPEKKSLEDAHNKRTPLKQCPNEIATRRNLNDINSLKEKVKAAWTSTKSKIDESSEIMNRKADKLTWLKKVQRRSDGKYRVTSPKDEYEKRVEKAVADINGYRKEAMTYLTLRNFTDSKVVEDYIRKIKNSVLKEQKSSDPTSGVRKMDYQLDNLKNMQTRFKTQCHGRTAETPRDVRKFTFSDDSSGPETGLSAKKKLRTKKASPSAATGKMRRVGSPNGTSRSTTNGRRRGGGSSRPSKRDLKNLRAGETLI